MPNQLKNETSPYLLQHADNPVSWFPWCDEALQTAQRENKPIFLSIGYAACHWCHVMAHESFEDPTTAALLNQHFIAIKVDREERPDLDGIYMSAIVAMTGQGGWPMSIFLTPEGQPFYGGTYFPPQRRYGMPAFKEVLLAVQNAWQTNPQDMRQTAKNLTAQLHDPLDIKTDPASLRPQTIDQSLRALLSLYDFKQGGWGSAPRFPQPMSIEFLLMQSTRADNPLREEALQAALHALNAMSQGGMYDVVGGGFHRYATDDNWLIPHFEKMLYDNAQLALVYLHAYQITQDAQLRRVCEETLDYILREMTHPEGGFYSSQDADSEGEEGRFYVWTLEEIEMAIPDKADRELLAKVYDFSPQGNFDGRIILQRTNNFEALAGQTTLSKDQLTHKLVDLHVQLLAVRNHRVRPGTDDKILTAWNAMALRAFAEAARVFHRADYLQAAQRNAEFLLQHLMVEGRLLRAWRNGQARHNAYLEDYAALILGLEALYQSIPEQYYLQTALSLAEVIQVHFTDPSGGFFDTSDDHESLITRPKELQDNATPSGNAMAALAYLRIAALDERPTWHTQAVRMLASLQELMVRHPIAFGLWLQAMDFATGPVRQAAIITRVSNEVVTDYLDTLWRSYQPRQVVAVGRTDEGLPTVALLRDRPLLQQQTTVYVCQDFTCRLPVNSLKALLAQIE